MQVQQLLAAAVAGALRQWQPQSKHHPFQAQRQASIHRPLAVMLELLVDVWACEDMLRCQVVAEAPIVAVAVLVLRAPGHSRHHGLARRALCGVQQREAPVWAPRVNAVDRSCQTRFPQRRHDFRDDVRPEKTVPLEVRLDGVAGHLTPGGRLQAAIPRRPRQQSGVCAAATANASKRNCHYHSSKQHRCSLSLRMQRQPLPLTCCQQLLQRWALLPQVQHHSGLHGTEISIVQALQGCTLCTITTLQLRWQGV
mmetsp:Transcript_54786/g.109028  ORF Transcript_54786/g.109028 Transcript_54786/m.109028 type:complete len:254 (-) Transcript_54786:1896-2657(-)